MIQWTHVILCLESLIVRILLHLCSVICLPINYSLWYYPNDLQHGLLKAFRGIITVPRPHLMKVNIFQPPLPSGQRGATSCCSHSLGDMGPQLAPQWLCGLSAALQSSAWLTEKVKVFPEESPGDCGLIHFRSEYTFMLTVAVKMRYWFLIEGKENGLNLKLKTFKNHLLFSSYLNFSNCPQNVFYSYFSPTSNHGTFSCGCWDSLVYFHHYFSLSFFFSQSHWLFWFQNVPGSRLFW